MVTPPINGNIMVIQADILTTHIVLTYNIHIYIYTNIYTYIYIYICAYAHAYYSYVFISIPSIPIFSIYVVSMMIF